MQIFKIQCSGCGEELLKNGPSKYDVNYAKLNKTQLVSIGKIHVVPVVTCSHCLQENTLPFSFLLDMDSVETKPETEGYVAWEQEYFQKYLKYENITRDDYLCKFE